MKELFVVGCATVLSLLAGPIGVGEAGRSIEVPQAQIRRAVVDFLQRHHPWKRAEVRIQRVRIPGPISLAAGEYEMAMRVPPNTRFLGHTPVEITFNPGTSSQKRVWASAYLEVLGPVVVVKRPLTRNHVLRAEDIGVEMRDLTRVPAGAMRDPKAVVGQRLKRTVGVGAVLRSGLLEKPLAVKRGDVVRLLIETERLKITALGRVDGRGGVGDTVRVINLDSKKRLYGEVVDGQTVRIRY